MNEKELDKDLKQAVKKEAARSVKPMTGVVGYAFERKNFLVYVENASIAQSLPLTILGVPVKPRITGKIVGL